MVGKWHLGECPHSPAGSARMLGSEAVPPPPGHHTKDYLPTSRGFDSHYGYFTDQVRGLCPPDSKRIECPSSPPCERWDSGLMPGGVQRRSATTARSTRTT
jgi:hypothetical protein